MMEVENTSGSSSEEEIKKRKKSSKHKKKHHKSKEKKHKKSKKHRRRSSSSEVSEEEEDAWVEAVKGKEDDDSTFKKPASENQKMQSNTPAPRVPAKEDENEWADFGSFLPTFSNDSKKAQRQKQKEEERLSKSIDKLGQHDRELNPYWKDGGIGLPSEMNEPPKPASSSVGDGGLAWLKKSFQRAKEQAQDEGRALEDVVSERWGSLEAFYTLLEEAENKAKGSGSSHREDDRDRHRDDRRHKSSKSFKRPARDSDSDGEDYNRRSKSDRSHRSSYSDSSRHRDRRRESDRNQDRNPGWLKAGAERPRSNDRKQSLIAQSNPKPRGQSPVRQAIVRAESSPKEEPCTLKDADMDVDDVAEEEQPSVLTDKEMNELNAKIFKAEMLGNTEMLASLKNQLQEAETARQDFIKNGGNVNEQKKTKVITKIIMGSQNTGRRKKDKITETHRDGERIRYFPDDDKYSLKTMFEREKMNTVEDENALFSRLAAKGAKASGDYDADEIFVDKASSSRQEMKEREREVKKALDEDKEYKKVIDDCPWCFDGKYLEKNLIVSIGQSSFLCVPPYQSLTDGHCLIVPMFHVSCATQLDEDVWSEIQKFRKALVRMFKDTDQDCVFFESAMYLKKQPHMYLECVPMPKETGELAPIYFKKAIQECETEWSQNKKVVDLRDKDVRRAIPKGLPYFSVEFADDNCGFGHVIEDEKNFPKNFAQEIIGGMLELDHQLWRKQKKDDFQKQRSKLMSFLQQWAPYDWTREDSAGTSTGV